MSAQRGGRAARRRARRPAPPLPQREGLDPVRTAVPRDAEPSPAIEVLLARFPALGEAEATPLAERFARGEIVDAAGRAIGARALVGPGDELWFHRELREEQVPEVDIPILLHDQHLLVIDKPHDMATMPRGAHVLSSALVRLRRATGITALTPLHRLDRRTAGVLAFGIRPVERSAYQRLFADGEVSKEYLARVAAAGEGLSAGERRVWRDRLEKTRGELRTQVVPGTANAVTEVEAMQEPADGAQLLRLRPRTGRTHQLRAQTSHRGMPILGDDLYPQLDPEPAAPLQLLAQSLDFTDPVSGERRELRSGRWLEG